MNTRAGTLYVVATPIGNVEDMSPRARETLAQVSLVAAEDTRHAGQLLTRLGISAHLLSLHEHNEEERMPAVLSRLRGGDSVALVSDAGTPLISDPGYRLVAAARDAGLPVCPIPGPCAAIAALSVAGLPTDRFHFEGFLPARAGARQARLKALRAHPETLVFYESVHRVLAMLGDAAEVLGAQRPAGVGRELTKLHESWYRGALGDLARLVAADPSALKGEYVVVVGGESTVTPADGELARVVDILATELSPAQAAALAARLTGGSRREAYRLALAVTKRQPGS